MTARRELQHVVPVMGPFWRALVRQTRSDWLTYLLVTIVAVFIWLWAAGETRDQNVISVRLAFTPPDSGAWDVQVREQDWVKLTIEGSALALQDAQRIAAVPFVLMLGSDNVPNEPGDHVLDVTSLLARHAAFRNTGIAILRSEPSAVTLSLDEIVSVEAEVVVRTPGIQTEAEPVAEPPRVRISLPRRLRETRFPSDLAVEAKIEPDRIGLLLPGQLQSRDVRLRLPEGLTGPSVRVQPTFVTVTFTVRSSIQTHTLETVRVQLAGPSESLAEYLVQLEPTVLRDVRISADAELIRKLESGEATVVAIVHVKHGDMEQGRDRKGVSRFMVIARDETDPRHGQHVELADDAPPLPEIRLTITRRADLPPS